VEKMFSFWN